jgi:hypothetical protein
MASDDISRSPFPHDIWSVPPDADGLLRVLRSRMDDDMLREIASADYGTRVEEHLAPLLAFRETGSFPSDWGTWCPMEVLELTRHSQPDQPDWKPGSKGLHGHWIRAFATACILRRLGEKEDLGYENSLTQSLAPMIGSLAILEANLNLGLGQDAAGFITWLATRFDKQTLHEEWPALASSRLIAGLSPAADLSDDQAISLAAFIAQSVAEVDDRRWFHEQSWLALAATMSALDLVGRPKTVRGGVNAAIAALTAPLSPEVQAWKDEGDAQFKAWLARDRDKT